MAYVNVDHTAEVARCFLRLANLPNYALGHAQPIRGGTRPAAGHAQHMRGGMHPAAGHATLPSNPDGQMLRRPFTTCPRRILC